MVNALARMLEFGIHPNWATILLGLRPMNGCVVPFLTIEEVAEYAVGRIEESQGDDIEHVVAIAYAKADEREEVEAHLQFLLGSGGTDFDFEKERWCLYFILASLSSLHRDGFEAYMELSEVWAMFDWPTYSPGLVRSDTFSHANLDAITDTHRSWADREKTKLARYDEDKGLLIH